MRDEKRERYLQELGLESGADWAAVVQAYQDLAAVWNPERFSEERLRKLAAEKLRVITDAYDYFRAEQVLGAPGAPAARSYGQAAQRNAGARAIVRQSKLGAAVVLPSPGVIIVLVLFSCLAGFLIAGRLRHYEKARLQAEIVAQERRLAAARLEEDILVQMAQCAESKQPDRDNASQLSSLAGESGGEPQSLPPGLSDFAELDRDILVEPALPAHKPKDKLYVLRGKAPVEEQIINYTPDIIDSSISCDAEAVERMLKEGTDVNTADDRGDTALSWAVRRRCLPVVRMLLARGADANVRSKNGFTPYVWSRIYKDRELQQLLEQAGADTKAGAYWWRGQSDTEKQWLERALSYACANRDCASP